MFHNSAAVKFFTGDSIAPNAPASLIAALNDSRSCLPVIVNKELDSFFIFVQFFVFKMFFLKHISFSFRLKAVPN
jgi:hypothetical protein